jgi:predicted transposase YdaD
MDTPVAFGNPRASRFGVAHTLLPRTLLISLPDSTKQGIKDFMANASESHLPHDGSYKHLFSHPEMVESLIQDFVPEEWVRELDFSTLERQNGSYVADDLRERHDDIIWRIRCKDTWFYIYLLIEFQSGVDPWMPLRMMTYLGLLYQDMIKSGHVKDGEMLPPVFPLVLYNGKKAWTARLDVAELIAPVSSALAQYRPSLRYFVLDEGQIPDESLDADSLAACLMRMERSPGPESLRETLAALEKKLTDKKYHALNRAFVVWINRVLLKRMMQLEPIPEVNNLAEVKTMLAERVDEWAEKWKMEGLQIGRQEGLQIGEQKGRQEGRQEGLYLAARNALRKRMSHDDVADLTGLSLEEVERLAADVLRGIAAADKTADDAGVSHRSAVDSHGVV